MRYAIGDVVRINADQVLGTVVCVSRVGNGDLIHLHTNGRGSRALGPNDVTPVTGGQRPISTGRAVATLLFVLVGIGVAVVNGIAVHRLDAGLFLTTFVAISSLTTVSGFLINRVHRTRPARI